MAHKFTCAMCHQSFEVETNQEDAKKEFEKNFPGMDITDAAEVCDDCYAKMTKEYPPEKFIEDMPKKSVS